MKSLETLQTTRASFSVGQAISDGWAIASKNWGYYILGGLLAVVIGGAAGLVPLVGGLANSLILSPCFMASAIFISWRLSKGIPWSDFGDIFKGFNLLMPLAISTLIQSVAELILVVLFFFNYLPQLKEIFDLSQGPDAYMNREAIEALFRQFFTLESVLLFLLLMLALLVLMAIWAFKSHFIVIYKLQAWEAMEMSRKIATHNLLPLTGLFVLLAIIIFVSAIPCGIGLLFSMPLSITAIYSAFAQITDCDATEIDNDMFDFVATGNE
jgi:magnesium-transporting ATPase (P-type)